MIKTNHISTTTKSHTSISQGLPPCKGKETVKEQKNRLLEAEALASGLAQLEEKSLREQKKTNARQTLKMILAEQNKHSSEKHSLNKLSMKIANTMGMTKKQKTQLKKVLKNPLDIEKKIKDMPSLDLLKEKIDPAKLKKALTLVETLKNNPLVAKLVKKNKGDGFLLAMAKATQALTDAVITSAKNDVTLQNLDNDVMNAQMKALKQELIDMQNAFQAQLAKMETGKIWSTIAEGTAFAVGALLRQWRYLPTFVV